MRRSLILDNKMERPSSTRTSSLRSQVSEEPEAITDGANDVVVVEQPDGSQRSTEFHVQIGKFSNWKSLFTSREGREIEIWVGGKKAYTIMTIDEDGDGFFDREWPRHTLTDKELRGLDLKKGRNLARYFVPTLDVEIKFSLFLYGQSERLVITDVDGTITTSDTKGFIYAQLGIEVEHKGVVRLLHALNERGYTVIYLTARSMGLDHTTRKYLFEDLQDIDDKYSLPHGPLFLSPKTVSETISEHYNEGPAAQKSYTIKSILSLFMEGPKIVEGAYGNTDTDEEAYRIAQISRKRTWIVNEDSVLRNAEDSASSSYLHQCENIDELYPRISN